MTIFRPGALARVPFPYVDQAKRAYRPAVVVAEVAGGVAGPLLWVLMVTSAENRHWPGDVPVIDDHETFGLPAPSLIRTEKIAIIAVRDAEWRGDIGPLHWAAVRTKLADYAALWTA